MMKFQIIKNETVLSNQLNVSTESMNPIIFILHKCFKILKTSGFHVPILSNLTTKLAKCSIEHRMVYFIDGISSH